MNISLQSARRSPYPILSPVPKESPSNAGREELWETLSRVTSDDSHFDVLASEWPNLAEKRAQFMNEVSFDVAGHEQFHSDTEALPEVEHEKYRFETQGTASLSADLNLTPSWAGGYILND